MMSRPLTSKPSRTGLDDGANVARGKIVAIEADVEGAGIDGVFLDPLMSVAQALGDGNAAALDADEADGGRCHCFFR